MKLYYGAYRCEGKIILELTNDRDCLSPQLLAGTFGHIEDTRSDRLSKRIAELATEFNATAVEFDMDNKYRIVEVR